jgi:cytochrome P450
VLYNLARLPDFQRDLRAEIQRAGLPDDVDYEKMPLLNAIINVRSTPFSSLFMTRGGLIIMQEVLRLYPTLPIADRVATADCVLPLSEPLTTTTGAKISEIPISNGQRVYVSTGGYHR